MAMKSKYRTFFSIMIGILIGCSVSFGQTLIQGTVAISSMGTIDYSGRGSLDAAFSRLCGWDLKGLNWQLLPNAWETETVFQQMRLYGVNMIRRHFVTEPLMESGSATRATYISRMKNNAEMAARNGMWIMFDMYAQPLYHGSGGLDAMYWQWQMPESQFLDMWEVLATELKDYDNVILELGNEPNDPSNSYPEHRDIWLQRCIKAIERMRAVGFQGYIVIPFPEVATYGHTAIAYRDQVRVADPLKRYMWDFHYYWYWQESQAGSPNDTSEAAIRSWLSSHGISQLRAMGDRVLCGELGVHQQNYDARDLTHFKNLLKVLNQDGYDYCAQSYQPGDDFPQLVGDWGTTDWHTLNTQGNVYVDALPLDISYYE
jgi:hypothetical protein